MLIDAPSFAPAEEIGAIREKLKRVGVIDIGSNSVRLVVFDGAARSPAYFFNEKVLCGLGRGVPETGMLHPEGRQSALASIRRFVALGEYLNLTALSAVATAAVREAQDGTAFVEEIARDTGLRVMVATGAEEATLSAQGVLLGWPDAEGLVCDIGGSSMELAEIRRGAIVGAETSGLGPLMLQGVAPEDRSAHIDTLVGALREKFPKPCSKLFLVGGSWRALAGLDMARRAYPLHVLHEYTMAPDQIAETAAWAASHSGAELAEFLPTTSELRLSLVPDAARVLTEVIERFAPAAVAVSGYGIREGLLYAHMPDKIRRLDPLIEAARHMEHASARYPGFGDALYHWLKPIYGKAEKSRRRLVRAACLLHDVTWRAHPDYRAEVCFESVTRANMGGLTHQERVFLGHALLNRYKSSPEMPNFAPVLDLMDDEVRSASRALGKALRLGAMISGGAARLLAQTSLVFEEGELTLKLSKSAHMQSGEVVERRLKSLADALGAQARLLKSTE